MFELSQATSNINTNGYATVLDVDKAPARLVNMQETFFLVSTGTQQILFIYLLVRQSETLKYLFLMFSNSSVVPLDRE